MFKVREHCLLRYRIHISILIFATIVSSTGVEGTEQEQSKCACSETISTIFENLNSLRLEVDANIDQLKKWAPLYPFVVHFREKLREEEMDEMIKRMIGEKWIEEEIEEMVKRVIEKHSFRIPTLPKPENIVMNPKEDEMQNDSAMMPKLHEESDELAKNVSNLLAKVEKVENRTMEVEEELKSERRVRRHLEKEVNETQSTLVFLEDQLQNVSIPMDAVMSHVQMVIFSSIEDMNRTIYEDHLQKLYYKVDGVVYKNETRKLDERIENVEAEIHDGINASTVLKLADDVKNLEETLQIINSSIGDKMIDLLNDTENFKRELSSVWTDIQDFRGVQQKLENFSMEWSKSLGDLQTQIEVLKNKTSVASTSNYASQTVEDPYDMDDVVLIDPISQSKNVMELGNDDKDSIFQTLEDDDTPTTSNPPEDNEETRVWEIENITTPENMNRLRTGGSADIIQTCDVPVTSDTHLLIDIEIEPDGTQKLVFGCRPIGEYVITNPPIPITCEGGSWSGPLPTCYKLLDFNTIELFSEELKKENPCTTGSGEFPDSTNCSRFVKCAHGNAGLTPCPEGLHYNQNLRICDYPFAARCEEDPSELIQQLQDLTPTILIEPNTVDKPSGLLGTGPHGQLIVHPRSSFTLHCLYPQNIWGHPRWDIAYSNPEYVTRNVVPQNKRNKVSLKITAATEKDSGLYRCITPFGRTHETYVLVKVVKCPLIPLDEEYEEVYYRPTPESETRILGSRAEFPCTDRNVFANCMANGKWSRGPPEEIECTLRKRCKPLNTDNHQDLILEEDYANKVVYFKCARGLRLVGDSYTKCLDDGTWRHSSLPRCVQ